MFRGNMGVDLFFVLSGFLITHLLLCEQERTGGVSLGKFYSRRFLRLAPAYYTYLAVIALIVAAGIGKPVPWQGWLGALTYTVGFVPFEYTQWVFGYWTLGVEEHFYALWPCCLVLGGRRFAVVAALCSLLFAPAMRFVLWEYWQDWLDDYTIFTRVDTLAVGCLTAFLVRTAFGKRLAALMPRYATVVCLAAFLCLVLSVEVLGRSGKYTLGPSRFVEASAFAAIVFACVNAPRSLVGIVCNWAPLAYIGTISYSLYIANAFLWPGEPWPFGRLANVGIFIGYAMASHYLVERPFLMFKDRFK
jgi:peptidoglycan/LPS O-acetylase OafA/YrhL